MKITKENKIRKSIKNLDFVMDIINKDHISHMSEQSLDELNKSHVYIKKVLDELIDNNFGQLKKQKSIK
tara:strand:- start:90 stop:296 length:207 start_codon:yes stop_codon:yes gene_type:complete